MRYADANEAALGDVVLIDGKRRGVVVAVIDTGCFSERFPSEQWAYLGKGILVDTDFGGVVHYPNGEDESIQLVRRAGAV
jgi:hypothetical protein